MDTQRYDEPKSSGLNFAEISDLAERFAVKVNYEPGGDLEAAVKSIGGEIIYEDFWHLEKSDSGSIRIEPSGREFKITLPNHTSAVRDRFTIGHELGHYVLHFLYPKSQGNFPNNVGMAARRFGNGLTEAEANWFSAAMLMPAKEFTKAFSNFDGDIELVATRFQVSTSAATVRSKVLSLA